MCEQLLKEWCATSIEECCDILDSFRIPVNSEERFKRQGTTPYYGATGQQGWIDGYIFDEPLILLAEDGGDFDNYVNKPIAYRIDGKSWINNHAHILRAKQGYHQDFVFYAIEHKDIRHYIKGGTRSKLNQGELRQIQLLVPQKLSLQKAIALILNNIDTLIQQTATKINKLTRLKAGLMQDLLTKGIDDNGEIRDPLKHPEQFENGIPKEWDIKSINELTSRVGSGVTPRGGSEVYQKQGVLFIRSQNVTFEGLLLEDVAYISDQIHSNMSNSRLHPLDVLLNITGASIGRCCVFPDDLGEANVNQHVCAIRLHEVNKVAATFLSYFLSSYYGQKQIACMNAGGNREGLNYSQIRSFHVPWPKSTDEITKIVSVLDSTKTSYDSVINELNKYHLLKQGLMQDLLTGDKIIPDALINKCTA